MRRQRKAILVKSIGECNCGHCNAIIFTDYDTYFFPDIPIPKDGKWEGAPQPEAIVIVSPKGDDLDEWILEK